MSGRRYVSWERFTLFSEHDYGQYRYVAIQGWIGVGKTNPVRHALPAHMFFLSQHMNQLRDLAQTDLFIPFHLNFMKMALKACGNPSCINCSHDPDSTEVSKMEQLPNYLYEH